ncbi:hypothetical protein K474DRAFT_1608890 [Panus rudis PR-1116 ss-1]|nr:hypothetical protein K474DRAFT_1608890 [Panus rudis PR-1116 ss-1]
MCKPSQRQTPPTSRPSSPRDKRRQSLPRQSVQAAADDKLIRPGQPWLEDGNIILIAQNTSFRVHRSVLSRQSDVFKDMFSVPGLEDHSEKMHDIPIVYLSDNASEVSVFLSAIYDGYAYFAHNAELPLEAVVALVRLGNKYQSNHLHEEGLRRLQGYKSHVLGEPVYGQTSPSSPKWRPESAVTLANLADSFDLTDILPAALYGCCQLGDALVDGVKHADGSIEHLSPLNLKRCLAARSHLVVAQSRIMSEVHFSIAMSKCERRGHGEECLGKTLLIPTQPHLSASTTVVWDPLRRMDAWWHDLSALTLCTACSKTAKDFYSAQRSKIIKDMPHYCGLA